MTRVWRCVRVRHPQLFSSFILLQLQRACQKLVVLHEGPASNPRDPSWLSSLARSDPSSPTNPTKLPLFTPPYYAFETTACSLFAKHESIAPSDVRLACLSYPPLWILLLRVMQVIKDDVRDRAGCHSASSLLSFVPPNRGTT